MDKPTTTQQPIPPYTRITRVGLDKVLPVRERLPGVHVSDIINFIGIQQGLWRENSEEDKWRRHPRFQLGLLFENSMGMLEVEEARKNNETWVEQWWCEEDGIILTPDVLKLNRRAVKDYKYTWKSSKKVLEDPTGRETLMWWTQIGAYLMPLDWRIGELMIGFNNGDCTWPMEPEVVEIERGFTRLELDRNWKKLVANKEGTINYMRERGKI